MRIQPRANDWITDEFKAKCLEVEPATIGHDLHFGFMDPRIKAVLGNVKVVGPAFTVKTTAYDSVMVHKAVSMAERGDSDAGADSNGTQPDFRALHIWGIGR
jgi:hypothetical protein